MIPRIWYIVFIILIRYKLLMIQNSQLRFQPVNINLSAACMCRIEPDHVAFRAPSAMNVTTPLSPEFFRFGKPTQRYDCLCFHIHQENFLFPHSGSGVGIRYHPFLVGRKRSMPVKIQNTISQPFKILSPYSKQNMRILFSFPVSSDH